MSQIYIWQSKGLSESEASNRFVNVIERQTAFYNEHLTTGCKYRFTRSGTTLVGQISSDLGIKDWHPWNEHLNYGVAWSGVCEDYLGINGDPGPISRLVKDVIEKPSNLAELTGSFSVCAWDFNAAVVAIATGATQHQTLWQTSGPRGWALGSRAETLFELVGLSAQFDEKQASTFLAYNYLLGTGALFKNVTRISGRQHIRLSPHKSPRQTIYQSLGDYLGQPIFSNVDEAVDICAESLKKRVARQLQYSRNPILHLTGGRDSRCIAAALHQSQFLGPSSTGGERTSPDVRIASRVAKKLRYRHSTSTSVDNIDLLALLFASRERVKTWTKLSEGVETIRHGLHYQDFFRHHAPFPVSVTQGFNGHNAGLQKPLVASCTPEKLNNNVGPHLKWHNNVLENFAQMRQQVEMDLIELGVSDSRWPELYLWQVDALHWGQDNLLVKDLFSWYWTPLFDKTLIQTGWHLPETHQFSMRFVEAVTLRLAPKLNRIPYELNLALKAVNLIRRKNGLIFKTARKITPQGNNSREALWKAVLFKTGKTDWKELIDEKYIIEAIETKNNEKVLWNTATVQHFIETNIDC